jgi:hypothetical protein
MEVLQQLRAREAHHVAVLEPLNGSLSCFVITVPCDITAYAYTGATKHCSLLPPTPGAVVAWSCGDVLAAADSLAHTLSALLS